MSRNNKLYKQQYSYNNSDNQSDNETNKQKENKKQISIKTYLVLDSATPCLCGCVCMCVCKIPVLRIEHSSPCFNTQDTVSVQRTQMLLAVSPHQEEFPMLLNGCVHLKCLQLVQKICGLSASVKPWDVIYSLHYF